MDNPNSSDDIDREITFFDTGATGGVVRDAFGPIAREAERRGYGVNFSADATADAAIGFYGEHHWDIPEVNADLSVVTFHGIDDSFDAEYYVNEHWGRYDVGLLPGQDAVANWQSVSLYPSARPRLGVFDVGWPKSDRIQSPSFQEEIGRLKRELGIDGGSTVLYAPTLESDDKVEEFLAAARTTFDNVMIKYGSYEDPDYDDLLGDRQADDDITIIDNDSDIIEPLAMADVLVSDQSSVLTEALLTETVPISVTDWPIRWGGTVSYPGDKLPPFVVRTDREGLSNTLLNVRDQYGIYATELARHKGGYFSNFGSASPAVLDLIDGIVRNGEPPSESVHPTRTSPKVSFTLLTHDISNRLPEQTKERLKKLRIDELVSYLNSTIG